MLGVMLFGSCDNSKVIFTLINRLMSIVVLVSALLTACGPVPIPTVAPTTAPTAAPIPKPTAEPTESKPLITELVVNDKATASSWSLVSNLQEGDQQFGDRSYAIASLPPASIELADRL